MFTIRAHCHVTTLVGFVLLAGSAGAQSVVRVGENRISVNAEHVPLVTLLKELSDIGAVERLLLDPSVERVPVSLKTEEVVVEDAIREILEAAGVNYTIWGGNGGPFRIFAGAPENSAGKPSLKQSELETGAAAASPDEPSIVEAPPFRAEEEPESPADQSVEGPPSFVQGVAPSPEEPRRPPTQPPDVDSQSSPSRPTDDAVSATDDAVIATGGAAARQKPDIAQVALTIAILGLGLLLGIALVVEPAHGPRLSRRVARYRTRAPVSIEHRPD